MEGGRGRKDEEEKIQFLLPLLCSMSAHSFAFRHHLLSIARLFAVCFAHLSLSLSLSLSICRVSLLAYGACFGVCVSEFNSIRHTNRAEGKCMRARE